MAELRRLVERQLQFIESVITRLVDTRHLARRSQEHAGEEVGEGRVILPVTDQAAQQIGTTQDRAVDRRRATQDDVVSATSADMTAIEQEFFGAEIAMARFLVKHFGIPDEFRPVGRRLKIDFDDAGVGSDLEILDAEVVGRRVALDAHGEAKLLGGIFHRGDQVEVIFRAGCGRHENMKNAAARLGANRGADDIRVEAGRSAAPADSRGN